MCVYTHMDEYKIVTGGIYLTSPTQGLVGIIDGDQAFNINTVGKKFTITTTGTEPAFTINPDETLEFKNSSFNITHTGGSTTVPEIVITKNTTTFSTGIALADSTNIVAGDAYVKTTSNNLVLSATERTKVVGRLTVYSSSKSLQDGSIGLINSNGNPESMMSLMAPGLENTGVINFMNVGQEAADRKSSIFYYKNTNALNTNRAGFSLFNGDTFEIDGDGNAYVTGNLSVAASIKTTNANWVAWISSSSPAGPSQYQTITGFVFQGTPSGYCLIQNSEPGKLGRFYHNDSSPVHATITFSGRYANIGITRQHFRIATSNEDFSDTRYWGEAESVLNNTEAPGKVSVSATVPISPGYFVYIEGFNNGGGTSTYTDCLLTTIVH